MNKYNYNTKLFEKPNKITYYLLGAYIADGCVESAHQNRIVISSKDEDWIMSIAKQVSSNSLPRKLKGSNCFAFYINSKKIVDWFVANQCTPKKSLTIKLPTISDQFFPHFMRGLFDGDGCITMIKEKSGITHSLRIYIAGGNLIFFKDIVEKLKLFNIKSHTITITNHNKSIAGKSPANYNDSYRLIINGKNAVKFCNFIYDCSKLHLERKYKVYLNYLDTRKQAEKLCTIREPFPDNNRILDLLKTHTYKEVGSLYNVSGTTVIGRLKRANLYETAKLIRQAS